VVCQIFFGLRIWGKKAKCLPSDLSADVWAFFAWRFLGISEWTQENICFHMDYQQKNQKQACSIVFNIFLGLHIWMRKQLVFRLVYQRMCEYFGCGDIFFVTFFGDIWVNPKYHRLPCGLSADAWLDALELFIGASTVGFFKLVFLVTFLPLSHRNWNRRLSCGFSENTWRDVFKLSNSLTRVFVSFFHQCY